MNETEAELAHRLRWDATLHEQLHDAHNLVSELQGRISANAAEIIKLQQQIARGNQ